MKFPNNVASLLTELFNREFDFIKVVKFQRLYLYPSTFNSLHHIQVSIMADDGWGDDGAVIIPVTETEGDGGDEGRRGDSEEGRKIFIGNCGEDVTQDDIQEAAEQHGEITDFYNPGKGFAFLTFSTPEEALACIAAMDGTEVAGQVVRMNIAKPKGNGSRILVS